MENVVLVGREVGKLQDATANQRNAADKKGVPYFSLAYNGKVFTVRQKEYDAWTAGKIYELGLNKGKRTIPDPDDDSKTMEVDQLQFGYMITTEYELNNADFEAKLANIKASVGKTLGISAEQMAKTI